MEPAALGKPVVIGPSVADFKTTVDAMLADQAIVQVDRDALPETLRELITDAPRRQELGESARECVRQHQGATERHAKLILELVYTAGASSRSNAPASESEAQHVRT